MPQAKIQLEVAIEHACTKEPRDFTESEKKYISEQVKGADRNPPLLDDLIFWYETASGDGYWTEANIAFFHSIV